MKTVNFETLDSEINCRNGSRATHTWREEVVRVWYFK